MAIVLCIVGRRLAGESWELGFVGVEVMQRVGVCDSA